MEYTSKSVLNFLGSVKGLKSKGAQKGGTWRKFEIKIVEEGPFSPDFLIFMWHVFMDL